ncbi:S41 family peptidase [Ekhidna sp.]|uniref:S41 family peptidase n=1 Tax=Ekhidna sp. TaxID=2608089 RepID=UPI003CCBFF3E
MRPFSLFSITICLLFSCTFTNANTFKKKGNLPEVERLYLTCKIWGFLKYYHPKVGKGTYDWDGKLMELLDKTDSIESTDTLSEFYLKWINNLGNIEECKRCGKPSKDELFLKNFNLDWFNDPGFSQDLQKLLHHIEVNRFQGKNHYVDHGRSKEFKPRNEDFLLDFDWSNPNLRLLVLFRYWNYVEYFFPYKYLTDQPWDEVLKEMIPKFLSAQTEFSFHLAVLELIVKVDDSHAAFVTPILKEELKFKQLPVRLNWIEEHVVVTSTSDSLKNNGIGLTAGDRIIAVNNKPTEDILNTYEKYLWGSNPYAKKRMIQYALFYEIEDSATITFKREDQVIKKNTKLYSYKELDFNIPERKSWKILEDSIGYVNMGDLTVGDVDEMMEELMDKSAIIFDIRNYPRGTYRAIAKYLKKTDATFAIFTRPDYSYPGKFIWSGASSCGEDNYIDYYKGKVILLVNENTQSHAEFTCMCLETAPNVVIIGSQTSGADGNTKSFNLFDNNFTTLTWIGVYYPDGRETQRIGIVPDIKIRPTIKGIKDGRDEVLEKAIEVARE